MADAAESTGWDKALGRWLLRHVPALISGVDIERKIDVAEIPGQAKELIRRVVRRTRLWPGEKTEITGELIAHFADGVAAGRSIGELVDRFGDERVAAKLIRRAKLRNRPLAWRATAIATRFLEVMLLAQGALAIRFYAGHPAQTVDYIAMINQAVHASAPDPAWPLYLQAMTLTRDYAPPAPRSSTDDNLSPSGWAWPWVVHYLQTHQAALDLVRLAAQKPFLGCVYGPAGQGDPVYLASTAYELQGGFYPWPLAGMLEKDCDLASQRGDSARWISNLRTFLGLSRQNKDQHFSESEMMAVHSNDRAIFLTRTLLIRNPKLLSDEDLEQVAHLLATMGTPDDYLNLDSSDLQFRDFLQHVYTPDGDGRLTPEGARMLADMPIYAQLRSSSAAMFTYGPWLMELVASRQAVLRRFNHLVLASEARQSLPPWDMDPEADQEDYREIKAGFLGIWRYAALARAPLQRGRVREWAQVMLAYRDGVEVGLALELYRRHHGSYPDSLDELTPTLLPEVPINPMNGHPVQYMLIDGKPFVFGEVPAKPSWGMTLIPKPPGAPRRAWPLYDLEVLPR